jgi:hypothetical protein
VTVVNPVGEIQVARERRISMVTFCPDEKRSTFSGVRTTSKDDPFCIIMQPVTIRIVPLPRVGDIVIEVVGIVIAVALKIHWVPLQ